MLAFKISTYNPLNNYEGIHFFILNKGLNSGKPLDEPCPNCFICECENEEESKQIYWLLFGLWQGKIFNKHLVGSVIPFIRINELKLVLKVALEKMNQRPEKFKSNIQKVHQIEMNRKNVLKQLEMMKQLKQILMIELIS